MCIYTSTFLCLDELFLVKDDGLDLPPPHRDGMDGWMDGALDKKKMVDLLLILSVFVVYLITVKS